MTSPYIHDSIERSDADVSNGQLSQEAQTFNWLLDSFTSGTAGVLVALGAAHGDQPVHLPFLAPLPTVPDPELRKEVIP